MSAELDNKMDRKIKITYSSSSNTSKKSRRSMTSKKSTTSKGSNKSSSSLKEPSFSSNSFEGRDQKEVVSHIEDNSEKREDSSIKIELNDELDRIVFNCTKSMDGNESDARCKMVDECSVGYNDVGSSKAPYLCTLETFSIDDDSCVERYNTYDETYQQLIVKKQEDKMREKAAAALKTESVENTVQMKSTIELPWRTKKTENDDIADASKAAEENLEEVAEEAQVETMVETGAMYGPWIIEEVKEDEPASKKNDVDKKKSFKIKLNKTSFFKKQKNSSAKNEDTRNKRKNKISFSFLKKKAYAETKNVDTLTNNVTKNEDLKEDMIEDLNMPVQFKDDTSVNELTVDSTVYSAMIKQIDDQDEADESIHSTSNIHAEQSKHSLSNNAFEEPTMNAYVNSTIKEEDEDDGKNDKIDDKNKVADVKVEGSNDAPPNNEDGHGHVNLESIGETLGTFINIAGDKLYDAYMGLSENRYERML